MTDLLKAILEAAPQLAVAILLVLIMVVIQRNASSDRKSYTDELSAITRRYTDELATLRTLHDNELRRVHTSYALEIAELKADVTELRSNLDSLGRQLDDERKLRRQAEDQAAQALRVAEQATK